MHILYMHLKNVQYANKIWDKMIQKKFEIQIAGERIYVPTRANFSIEHERGGSGEEIEFQIKWSNDQ